MAQFEWQTEEDEERWDEVEKWPPEPPQVQENRRRRWLALLAILSLVGATIFFSYRQVTERVSDATADVKSEVLASHDIVRYAAEQQDREVLVTFLSGRDPEWSLIQQDLVGAGALLDYPNLGLHLLPAGPPERAAGSDHRRVISVTLAPDLTEATVVVAQAYTVIIGNGVTETIYLQQESVYRKGEDRWLYSPPEDDPIYVEEAGSHVVLHYDQREGEVARRLAGDLDRKVAELCNLPDTVCPTGFQVHVRLESTPESLGHVADPVTFLNESRPSPGQRDQTVRLPAPSLVGLPLDENGYRALYRGYAAQVLRPILTWRAWPWECCDHAPVFQALVEQQLVRLGLQVTPLREGDYERLLQENFALFEDTMASWYGRQFAGSDSRAWLEGQAVVSFLLAQNAPVSLGEMAGKLNQAANFWFWAYEFLGYRMSDDELTQAWIQFAYEQAGLTQGEPPGPWPSAEALLLCGTDYANNQQLYRYDPEANALAKLLEGREFLNLQQLPNGKGVLLVGAEGAGNEREIRLSLWRDGALMPLWNSRETNVSLSYIWSAVDASGEKLTMAVEGREGTTHILLDLAACAAGECHAQVLPGGLFWSPDGTHSLLFRERGLLLADGQGEVIRPVITDTFGGAFWLDDDTYGYLRRAAGETDGPALSELVAASVETGSEEVLVSVRDLAAYLPHEPAVYNLSAVIPNPANRDQLLLQVIDYTSSSSSAALFQLKRTTGEVTHFLDAASWQAPVFAPDGKWLALNSFDRASGQSRVILYEFEGGRQMRLLGSGTGALTWSPDGRWLLHAGGAVLHLTAPDDNYRQVMAFSGPPCSQAAWVR